MAKRLSGLDKNRGYRPLKASAQAESKVRARLEQQPKMGALAQAVRAEFLAAAPESLKAKYILPLPISAADVLSEGGPVGNMAGYFGRLLRGTREEQFEKLSPDEGRRTAFVMNGNGLRSLRRSDNTPKSGAAILETVGYTHEQIKKTVAAGNRFELAVIPPSANAQILPATWPNVLKVIAEQHADHLPGLAAAFEKHGAALARTPFEKIEAQAGYSFAALKADDPRYMTPERFGALKDPTLVQVRSFLYHTEQLRELFAGDGFTLKPSGQRGVREFITPNVALDELRGATKAPLPPSGTPLGSAPPVKWQMTGNRDTARALNAVLLSNPSLRKHPENKLGVLMHEMMKRLGWSRGEPYSVFLGDIEGLEQNPLETAIKHGVLRRVGGALTFTDQNAVLVVLGDLVDRGPRGLRTVLELADLKEHSPDRVHVVLGNHEMGKGDILPKLRLYENLEEPAFVNWLAEKQVGREGLAGLEPEQRIELAKPLNTVENRLQYYLENRAARGQLAYHTQELNRLNGQATEPQPRRTALEEMALFREELSLLRNAPVSAAEAAQDYIDSFKPGGRMFRLFTKSTLGVSGGSHVGLPPGIDAFHGGPSNVSLTRPIDGQPAKYNPSGTVDFGDFTSRNTAEGERLLNSYAMTGVIPERLVYVGESAWDGVSEQNRSIDVGTTYTAGSSRVLGSGKNRTVDPLNRGQLTKFIAESMAESGRQGQVIGHRPIGPVPVFADSPNRTFLTYADTSYSNTSKDLAGSESLLIATKQGMLMVGRAGPENAGRLVTWTRALDRDANTPVGKVTTDGFLVNGVTIDDQGGLKYYLTRYVPGHRLEQKLVDVTELRKLKPVRNYGEEREPGSAEAWRTALGGVPFDEAAGLEKADGKTDYRRKYTLLTSIEELESMRQGRPLVGVASSSKLGMVPFTEEQSKAAMDSMVDTLGQEVMYLTGGSDPVANIDGRQVPAAETQLHRKVAALRETSAGAPPLLGLIPSEQNIEGLGSAKAFMEAGPPDDWDSPLLANLEMARQNSGVMVFAGGGATPAKVLREALDPKYSNVDFILFASDPVNGQIAEPKGASDALAADILSMPEAQRPKNIHLLFASEAPTLGALTRGLVEDKRARG